MEENETPTPVQPNLKEYKPLLPFPSRLKKSKCEREDEDIMEIFRNVEIFILCTWEIWTFQIQTISFWEDINLLDTSDEMKKGHLWEKEAKLTAEKKLSEGAEMELIRNKQRKEEKRIS
uniref:Uncharacterized protein n=1 Tax=Lactuca sativa TaxID=4236 RepID=A0A9R1W4Z3_LACSA|nr:hypothetical protein LSAT_V11C300150570 [Lactuca sativa]